MLPYLEQFKTSDETKEIKNIQKKILCIIEGDTEFRYITKIFQLYGYINNSENKDCFNLSETFIRIAWGNKFSPNINIVQETKQGCMFEGGNSGNQIIPFQSISAFEMYKEDLSIFDSVIVMFDSDKDKENKVEKYFISAFKELSISNCLLVSTPCLESTLIDFCNCGECNKKLNEIEDTDPACNKYKNCFSKLKCLSQYSTANGLIANLKDININEVNRKDSKLNNINSLINNYMQKKAIND